ncbi:MAG: hypothetical protein KTR19_04730 [Hyphomicrobiales bacterium]|nr:hypothetical protein [Hyphomicrobiales bacterium]
MIVTEEMDVSDDEPIRPAPIATALASPRIHMFCEAGSGVAKTADILHSSHLELGSAEIHAGGFSAAIAAYERKPSPDLLIVETHSSPQQVFSALETLAPLCQEHSRLIIIGQINDVNFYRALLRCDVSDYLVAPLAPGQLASSIRSVLNPVGEPATSNMIAVIGAKGGCGASTICHNLGWTLAETQQTDTVITDCNPPFGTLGLNFNQDAGHGLAGALAAGEKLDAAMMETLLARCSDHLSLLIADGLLTDSSHISPASATHIAMLLRQTARIALFDIPCAWNGGARTLIEQADDCIVVAEPDLVNLRNARNLFAAIRADRDDGRSPLLVLNKAGMPRRPEISAKDFADALDVLPSVVVDFDARLFGMAANNGLMVEEVSPRSPAAKSMQRLAGKLACQRLPKPTNLSGRNPVKALIDSINRQFAAK